MRTTEKRYTFATHLVEGRVHVSISVEKVGQLFYTLDPFLRYVFSFEIVFSPFGGSLRTFWRILFSFTNTTRLNIYNWNWQVKNIKQHFHC